ncbi:MAG: S49 family peptidase [Candidatus Bathyarchaeia archaeon]|nr:S49 family peptidase [Candidatus Bathyarchaeota archaeon]
MGAGSKLFNSWKKVIIVLMVVLAALSIFTFLLSPRVPQREAIAILNIYGPITSDSKRDYILDMVEYCRRSYEVKAVVLRIDSPGGYADAVQDIYLNLLELGEEKPVVASIIGLGLSGGYYIALSAEVIYAVPAAMIGNIGVIGTLPEEERISEDVIETGPYKQRGVSERLFPFQVQLLLDDFLDKVEIRRNGKLRINRSMLSKGMIYVGVEALEYGLIDGIGSTQEALEEAATLAHLKGYKVITVDDLIRKPYSPWTQETDTPPTIEDLMRLHEPPTLYYIYAPSEPDGPGYLSTTWKASPWPRVEGNKTILIDYSHDNAVAMWELNVLLYELSSRGYSVRYLNSSDYLEEMLNGTAAFIVVSPRRPFLDGEVSLIKEYVEDGGKLLLVTDPTRSHASNINTLSAEYGIVFAEGYLYNLEENHGNYRNVILTDFVENEITRDLRRIVLYTATYIHGSPGALAFTSISTFSSEAETSGRYSPIVIDEGGGVLAIGDQTFMLEPYCRTFDNYRLLRNIASFLAGS